MWELFINDAHRALLPSHLHTLFRYSLSFAVSLSNFQDSTTEFHSELKTEAVD